MNLSRVHIHGLSVIICWLGVCTLNAGARANQGVLDANDYAHYVRNFNSMESEQAKVGVIPNAQAWDWMTQNIPLFDCPAKRFEEIYYYRWWTFRKHIKIKNGLYIVSEFVTWSSPISCSFSHHISEGRWLHDQHFLDEYVHYWYRGGTNGAPASGFHNYSSWAPDALYRRYLVNMDQAFLVDLLNDFIADYQAWSAERMRPDGLYWQYDVRDGMEESISGSRTEQNVRPTINSYMAANARALAAIAALAGRNDVAAQYQATYESLRQNLIAAMWDNRAAFFKVRFANGGLSNAREAIGFIPWTFNLAGPEHANAWLQLTDPNGFWAPRGLTTAERRHPAFRTHGVGTCEWDGAVWPFATSQTLDGLANMLCGAGPHPISNWDYFNALLTYAQSHQMDAVPYLGEYLDEVTGEWLKGRDSERSRYYNHSTFNDLVITGLIGLKPRPDDIVEVAPLLPADGAWNWFCLDRVAYHGRLLTILWDRDGSRYGRGAGLRIYADDQLIAQSPTLTRVTGSLTTR